MFYAPREKYAYVLNQWLACLLRYHAITQRRFTHLSTEQETQQR